jgi:RNA polymerase sigma-70 factor, ECF subfamily
MSASETAAGPSAGLSEFSKEALTHLGSLLAVAKRLTRAQAEAEDLVQDTLVKALKAREQFQAGTNLRAWLLKILKNTFISRYHRGQMERAALSTNQADPVADGWLSSASIQAMRDPEANVLRPQLEQRIRDAIDSLPEEFRMVVVLADAEGFAYREIAETLGCPIGTVMSRLHRARRILKAQLVQDARELGLVPAEVLEEQGATGVALCEPSLGRDAEERPIDLHAYRAGRGHKSR